MKLLIVEPGSATAAAAWNAADDIVAVRLLYPEARAALAAAHRTGRVPSRTFAGRKKALEETWAQVDAVELTAALAQTAGDLAERHGLRAYDAVHLASAVLIVADVVVSADAELIAAAATSGLAVIDTRS
jgi:uncharacterized protein